MIHRLLIQHLNCSCSQNEKTAEQKCLNYIGNVTVNGFPGIGKKKKPIFQMLRKPKCEYTAEPCQTGTKQILDERGADGLVKWIKDQEECLLTDTTFRDAHQSLLATRVRTYDITSHCRTDSKTVAKFILI